MTDEDLNAIIIESIARVRTSPRAKQHLKVLIVFRDEECRETILSYARNLSGYVNKDGDPSAGLRLEIPDFLASTHKLLLNVCFYLKTKHGKETRQIIKFDDIDQSLYLAFKMNGSDQWKRITPKMAATYREREDARTTIEFEGVMSPPDQRSINFRLTGGNSQSIPQPSPLPSTSERISRPRNQTWTPADPPPPPASLGQRRAQ